MAFLAAVAPAPGVASDENALCRDTAAAATFERRAAGSIQILSWDQTVCLEHSDRVKRLKRLGEILPPGQAPVFLEHYVGRNQLPVDFPVGMPLLRVVFPERSFFDTASSRIRPEAEAALQIIAASLRREVPDVALFVAGHTDSRGGEDYNHNLSVDRSESVALRLKAIGVGPVALWRVGFGETVPIKSNDTEQGMAANRRVEFLFGPRAEPVAAFLAQQDSSFCAGAGATTTRRCKKELKRREFEAVAVTARTGLTAKLPPRTSRQVAAPGGAGRRVETDGSRVRAEIPTRGRIVIDVSARKFRVPAPTG